MFKWYIGIFEHIQHHRKNFQVGCSKICIENSFDFSFSFTGDASCSCESYNRQATSNNEINGISINKIESENFYTCRFTDDFIIYMETSRNIKNEYTNYHIYDNKTLEKRGIISNNFDIDVVGSNIINEKFIIVNKESKNSNFVDIYDLETLEIIVSNLNTNYLDKIKISPDNKYIANEQRNYTSKFNSISSISIKNINTQHEIFSFKNNNEKNIHRDLECFSPNNEFCILERSVDLYNTVPDNLKFSRVEIWNTQKLLLKLELNFKDFVYTNTPFFYENYFIIAIADEETCEKIKIQIYKKE